MAWPIHPVFEQNLGCLRKDLLIIDVDSLHPKAVCATLYLAGQPELTPYLNPDISTIYATVPRCNAWTKEQIGGICMGGAVG